MNYVLGDIEYKGIFKYFEEISSIPRGSGNDKAISDYLVQFAISHNLKYTQDKFLNVIIVKEATTGYEKSPTVMLQGHMDMVCEKNIGNEHDFLKDGLDLNVKDDFIYAKGTTLGGDDGIALAYALAILDSKDIPHPRLEVVITTDEETGMDGARGIDLSNLQGKFLLNIDSEEEGVLLCSSAGGLTGTSHLPIQYETKKGKKVVLSITGLQGGHSGTEINKNRTNANRLMARLLLEISLEMEISLVKFNGGLKDNAIPRESIAELIIGEAEEEKFKRTFEKLYDEYKVELKISESDINITNKIIPDSEETVLNKESFDKLIIFLLNVPNGVQVMSADIENLVESSVNLGILNVDKENSEICFSVRSSLNSYKHFISNRIKNLTEYLGGDYIVRGEYPAWEYKRKSILRDMFIKIYKEEYGYEPKIEAIHAGLECGLIAEKKPGIDIISFGPDILDIHTPLERLCISSSNRVFDYLLKVLEHFKDVNE